ncbi:MAG: Type 1 glutamine amidotransferase-like domain-containing protein [Candidatus Pacebacteria bacterium]|nr:Type 1 glutamine amidotransferase-like domain-containing protein [Candidatus Paceibacterota bacterium]
MARLDEADIIWMGGGAVGYLMYWLRRHALDKTLPQILDQDKIYIGSSAGSMVAGPSLSVCEWNIGDVELGASFIPGFGLVDFEIYPHFRDDQLTEIKKLRKQHPTKFPLYLLKDGEVIIKDGGEIKFFGEERKI